MLSAIQLLKVTETLGPDLELVHSKCVSMTSVWASPAVTVSLNFVVKTVMIHFSSCVHSLDFYFLATHSSS